MIYHYGVLPKYVKDGSILSESASLTTSGADLQIGDGLFFDPTTQWPNGRGFFLICNNANYSLFFNSQSLNNFHFFFNLCRVESSPCLYCLHRSNVEEEGACWEPSNHWRNNRLCNEWRSEWDVVVICKLNRKYS